MGEPWLLPCGGYGPVAAEADGVAGAIVIGPVLEVEAVRGELKNFGGHEWPAFKRRNFAAIDHSTLRLRIHPLPLVDELGGWFELGICEVDLFPVRRVDRDDSASFGYDVSDGAILTRYGAVLVAILHKQVEIGEGADVAAFRNVKPVGVGGSGYGSMASETCRIPSPVVVIPMRERHEDSGAPQRWRLFNGLENTGHDFSRSRGPRNCIPF